jgi:hypothetical protein
MIQANHEYHVVELHYISDEILNWCSTQFNDDSTRWFCTATKIYFFNRQDHMMFVLRWS